MIGLLPIIGWAFYSIPAALGILVVSLFVSMFYAGALKGGADEKAKRAFIVAAFVLSFVMLGIFGTEQPGGPPMCSAAVQC